ncbi:MAG: tRNA pseudouridine(55) synthase TruB [Nitrospiria bacterium]
MPIEGVLNINKPAGWTSHDVVARVRKLLKTKKAGHTGTLDPQATGVLPVCLGKGTKIIEFLVDSDKEYDAVLRLGQETDTQDATGKALRSIPVQYFDADTVIFEGKSRSIPEAFRSFIGPYRQMPPMYSAVKVNGEPLYKAARAGKTIERSAREVSILGLQIHNRQGDDISFSVRCSKGTYIRTLCADIGENLGVGGHLVSLRRTRSGNFQLGDSIEMDQLCELVLKGTLDTILYPLNEVLKDLPALCVKESHLDRLKHGVQIGPEGISDYDPFKSGDALRFLDHQGKLLALGFALQDSDIFESPEGNLTSLFKIRKVLSDLEAQLGSRLH